MSILPAQTIQSLCLDGYGLYVEFPLIRPFRTRARQNGMSFGLSSCGYDVRIERDTFVEFGRPALASTLEQFHMPNDVMGEVKDKSTWARKFLTVQNTVIEPGWRGFLTLELTLHDQNNTGTLIKAGTPIAQIIFYRLEAPTDQPYRGKYQDQEAGPQSARYEK